jgi:cyanophycin synthetase
MKVTRPTTLTGPNLSGPVSGLRARLVEDGDPLCGAAWTPDDAELGRAVATLVAALPELAVRRDEIAAGLARETAPSLALVLLLAETLLREGSVLSGRPAVLERDATGATVFLPCDTGALGALALHFGIEGTRQLAGGGQGTEAHMRALHLEARRRMRPLRLDQTTRTLARAARLRGIPAVRLAGAPHVLRLGEGAAARRIQETVSEATGHLAALLQRDKVVTQALLAAHFLPGTGARPVASAEEACTVAREIGFPVVVKPRQGRKGAGVVVSLRDEEAVRAALARPGMLPALVERHVTGRDYRLLVAGGRLVAAAERRPAEVVGTGRHSVAELVETANRDPQRGLPFERPLELLALGDEARRWLGRQGLAPESVPAAGQLVRLAGPANLSAGGTARDVTGTVAPQTARQVVRAARLLGLDVAGIDVVAPDIARPLEPGGGAILEVNVSPGLRPHADADRDVAAAVIGALFPEGATGRIPTVGITGSLGKSTTCRMLARILRQTGRCVALTTTKGAYIGQERLSAEDCAGGGVAERLLDDASVEMGVFELARGNLIKRGMVLDSLSVGALLNVRDNHVGFDGVETREQMATVKSIVPCAARDVAVLNADDPLCLSVRPRLAAPRLCLVSPIATRAAPPRGWRAMARSDGSSCGTAPRAGRWSTSRRSPPRSAAASIPQRRTRFSRPLSP